MPPASAPPLRLQVRDAGIWLAVLAVGVVLSRLAAGGPVRPFGDSWTLGPASALAPLVAGVVLVAAARGWHVRLAWRPLLGVSAAAALVWALTLAVFGAGDGVAGELDRPDGLIAAAKAVGDGPAGWLAGLDGSDHRHPPGAVLVVWWFLRLGVDAPGLLGALFAVAGAAAVPLVLVAVRSLCHEAAARQFSPVLVLAPFAAWLPGAPQALVVMLLAGAVACGTVGSEPRRTPWWAAAAGLLLGVAALVSYAAWLLAAAVVITYFVRRRPMPNLVTGAAFLAPLFVAQISGFAWADGFAAARDQLATADGAGGAGWVGDLVVLVAVAGPAIVASARKVRRTPGWPYLVGAALGGLFALVTGLTREDAAHAWLPFLPWLLVAAVAPERRPPRDAPLPDHTGPVPLLLVAVGAAAALVWRASGA